ncbi:hypothetical protein Ciccas_014152 [Cichlidogyrus casuarinus]|uniref:G-protein coupled receptors family 1 profile domain-containing protein n=1 Tax=Cichlidogyrus casuarinus TaxID=1844966 RepID=A0ABD2PK71_9PLAT
MFSQSLQRSGCTARMTHNGSSCDDYFNAHVDSFHRHYQELHVKLIFALCPLDLALNTMNMIVLNQRKMISPTNFLLTCLALCDCITMISYLGININIIYETLDNGGPYAAALSTQICMTIVYFCHQMTTGIILILAIFRILCIQCLASSGRLCSMFRAKLAVFILAIISLTISLSIFLGHEIDEKKQEQGIGNGSKYYMLDTKKGYELYVLVCVPIIVKVIPLSLLTILTFYLVFQIKRQQAKHRRIKGHDSDALANTQGPGRMSIACRAAAGREKSEARTTRLLLLIVAIFLIAYTPNVSAKSPFLFIKQSGQSSHNY